MHLSPTLSSPLSSLHVQAGVEPCRGGARPRGKVRAEPGHGAEAGARGARRGGQQPARMRMPRPAAGGRAPAAGFPFFLLLFAQI
jgi:hypothetical protein